ncbi:hypothetical protein HN873_001740 [Arachis hypogaea]
MCRLERRCSFHGCAAPVFPTPWCGIPALPQPFLFGVPLWECRGSSKTRPWSYPSRRSVRQRWPVCVFCSHGCGARGPDGVLDPRLSLRSFGFSERCLPLCPSEASRRGGVGSAARRVSDGFYLVDPASSHMLVSKIKPCMYKRSTQALPVALMIHDNSSDRTALVPATHHSNFCPINFRCWTLGWADRSAVGVHRSARPFCQRCAPGLNWPGRFSGAVTLKKLECSKQAYALYTLAWDNIIGFRSYCVGLRDRTFAKDVFINQERKLGARRRSDTVLVSTINDADQGSADVAFRTPLAPYEKSKSLGSGGSMVARLKLKGIDGRAPPGVEPAA